MPLSHFMYSSVKIFILTFIVGILLDKKAGEIQKRYNLSPPVAGVSQLFAFLFIVYAIQQSGIIYLERYLPHTIFSTFMFTLQTNMIQNFKIVFDA